MLEHSRNNAAAIAQQAASSPATFKQLMECFISEDSCLAQRAAWSVSIVAETHPKLIQPYLGKLVALLTRKDVHHAVIRNALRTLQGIEIPRRYHGKVMKTCFDYIEEPGVPPAIKAFSLTILSNLSKTYPEIRAELRLLIEENWENETPAFRSRGRKVLKAL